MNAIVLRARPIVRLPLPELVMWPVRDIPVGGLVPVEGSGFTWDEVDHSYTVFSIDAPRGKALLRIVDHSNDKNGADVGVLHLGQGSLVESIATNRPPRAGQTGLRIVVSIRVLEIPHEKGIIVVAYRYRYVPFT